MLNCNMEANSIGQSGDADPPGQPPEEEKSYEEIALIHAAMMVRLISSITFGGGIS